MRVIIADDHPIFRSGLKAIIDENEQFELVGEVGRGDDALGLIETERPDMAVLDIAMPGMEGLDVVEAINDKEIECRFIILTMYREEEYFDEAMDLGVMGYLLKDSASVDLIRCMNAVARGKHFVTPFIADYLVKRRNRRNTLVNEKPRLEQLTETEIKIIRSIADNKTSREIAEILGISFRTVQNHRNNICGKLGLKGPNRLLQFALENKSII